MPNTRLSLALVPKAVKTRLGGSGVNVEVTTDDIQECLQQAFDYYNGARPQYRTEALSVSPTVKRYVMDKPMIQGIVKVEFIPNGPRVGDQIDPFDTTRPYLPGSGSGDLTTADYVQQMTSIEDARRVFNADADYTAQWEAGDSGPVLALYVDVPQGVPYLCSVTYTWHVTADDSPATGMKWVPNGDAGWILDYTLCKAKQILGRLRGKFGGVPDSNDGNSETDWQQLLTEGQQEQTQLEDALKRKRRPLPPDIG